MKIGIVGYGSIGQRHAHNFEQLGHHTMVYDPAPNKRCDVKFERDIYDHADAVVICTPSRMHPGCLRAAIERGKPVLVEKPIATSSPDQIADLLAFSVRQNVPVMMGNMLRFHPLVMEAASLPSRPQYAWFSCHGPASPTNQYDGVILNTGSHEVDLASYLLGPVILVLAAGTSRDGVFAHFMLKHASGAHSAFDISFTTPITRTMHLISHDAIRRDLVVSDQQWDAIYLEEARSFIDMIEGKPDPRRATGDDGLATLRVLLDVKKIAEAA